MALDRLCITQHDTRPRTLNVAVADENSTFECDYDKNPTSLYQALEEKAWFPLLEFFETGTWPSSGLCVAGMDPLTPEEQARTWVTRFEKSGRVRWSQLPLHASLIFGAPYKVVAMLVKLYPQAVRCTDDQHMLPLHLALKFGATDSVVRLFLEKFPESIFTKDLKGRVPSQVDAKRNDRSQIMDTIISVTTKVLHKKESSIYKGKVTELRDDLVLHERLNIELEKEKTDLETKYQQSQSEVSALQSEVDVLKEELKKMQMSLKRTTSKKSKTSGNRSVCSVSTRTVGSVSSKRSANVGPEMPVAISSKSKPSVSKTSTNSKQKTVVAEKHVGLSRTKSKESQKRGFFSGFGAKE